MEELESFGSVAVALAVGLLVGIERQQSYVHAGGQGPFLGGIRTLPLVALAGCLAALVSRVLGPWLVVAGFISVAGLVAISYADDVRRDRERGLTSEVLFLLTFLLGAIAGAPGVVASFQHRATLTIACGVIITLLLSAKPRLHAFVRATSPDDVLAAVKFSIVAFIVLPLLPDRAMGPLQAVNPFRVGLMIALIAAVSFVAYVAVRVLGSRRGIAITALVGGLVSSTAVTLTFAHRARNHPSLAPACALAVIVASSIMFMRMLILVAFVSTSLAPMLAIPLLAMAGAGAVVAFILQRTLRDQPVDSSVNVTNPFELGAALKFGLLFGVVVVAVRATRFYFGDHGLFVAGALAGTTDVDAITLSTSQLVREGLDPSAAVTTILLAAVSNSLVKASMAGLIGGRDLAKRVLPGFAVILLAGATALGLVRLATPNSIAATTHGAGLASGN